MPVRRIASCAAIAAALACARDARADGVIRLESVDTALSAIVQEGEGYQSQAGPIRGPGSERLTVFQPQVAAVLKQGERLRHRVWFPVDIVTSASTNAVDSQRKPPDVMSEASRQNQAGSVDWTATYAIKRATEAHLRNGFHLEENFRSWNTGAGVALGFAEDNATLSISANHLYDWFDRYDATGHRLGRTERTTTNGNVGLSQILSPTTIVNASYGVSVQYGTLGSTWNTIPFDDTRRGIEILPLLRVRHALVGRFAQWLPWNGALKGSYRFYADDWGLVAHSAEVQLHQRLASFLRLRASYRFHHQSAVDFWATQAAPDAALRTADSDLAAFDSHALGGKAILEGPFGTFREAHFDAGWEHYFRTDGLKVDVALVQTGARF